MHIRFFQILFSFLLLSSSAWAVDCDSYFKDIGKETYPYMSSTRTNEHAKKIAEVYEGRSEQEHAAIDAELTRIHSQREMNFQVKNPVTGYYDSFVDVPVNSRAVVIDSLQYEKLIQSTGPVLRTLRGLLQKIYSGVAINAKNLELEHLDQATQDIVISVIKESIYFEPELVHSNMSDYPFLAVAGFDGAIGDPDNPHPRFFEMNLGTPSGLSNNTLLLEALLKVDEQFRKTIGPYLPEDETFGILKESIESNAKAWTRKEGLSVIISPGVYNGGHADVAAISSLSGMPLVKVSDLYIDENGDVRLLSQDLNYPIVTGIYGRTEESYFLQNSKVPMISPSNIDTNTKLSRDLGLKLRSAASYVYKYDDEGRVIGIEKDSSGQPLLQEVWDQLGAAPNGYKSELTLLDAVVNKKLYYSAIGGRVVDDKRLFPIIAEHLVSAEEKSNIARPVSTLNRDEYDKLYENPSAYVVKEPNNSGGVGVYFLLEMEKEDLDRLLEKVRSNPLDYEVQELRNPNTLVNYSATKPRDIQAYEVATDIRIFPMMDAEGNVRAGANSLLLRTGPDKSFFSNTSMGGGYGIVAITRGQPVDGMRFQSYEVGAPFKDALSAQQLSGFEDFLQRVWSLSEHLNENSNTELRDLSFAFRDFMELLPEHIRYLPSLLREYADLAELDEKSKNQFKTELMVFFWDLFMSQGSLDYQVRNITESFFESNEKELSENEGFGYFFAIDQEKPEGLELRYLKSPDFLAQYSSTKNGVTILKQDVAEVIKVPNPRIQKLIDEIRSEGGEIRVALSSYNDFSGKHSGRKSYFYQAFGGFWVSTNEFSSSYMKPTITAHPFSKRGGVDEAQVLSSLSHEMEHFRFWKEKREELVATGLSIEEASKEASELIDTEENLLESERRAVDKEIEVEKVEAARLGLERIERPLDITHFGYVNRVLYPEFEAMLRRLRKSLNQKLSEEEQLEQYKAAKALIATQVKYAIHMRQEVTEKLIGEESFVFEMLRKYFPKISKSAVNIHSWENEPLVDLLTYPFGIERLVEQGTLKVFVRAYKEVLDDLGIEDSDYESSKTYETYAELGMHN